MRAKEEARAEEVDRSIVRQNEEIRREKGEKVPELRSQEYQFGTGRTVGTQLQEAAARPMLKEAVESQVRAERPIEKAIEAIRQSGDTSKAEALEGLSVAEQSRIKAAMNERAILNANNMLPVPALWNNVLTADTKARIKLIQEAKKREMESATKTWGREFGKQFLVSAASVPEMAIGAVGSTVGEGLAGTQGPKAPSLAPSEGGIIGSFDGVKTLPFLTTNVFMGNEEDGILKTPAPPSLLGSVYPEVRPDGANVAMQHLQLAKDNVKSKVESIYGARMALAEADKKPYEEGLRSFKKGNREGVVKSIIDLEKEEGKFKDRWALLEQAHRQVLSAENYEGAYADDGNKVLGWLGGSGGYRLAEETQKLNEVKAAVKQANYDITSRKKLLQSKLQMMDAKVPLDVKGPKHVQVFGESASGGKAERVAEVLTSPGKVMKEAFDGEV